MPIYLFEHPQTKEIYEVLRSFSKMDDPYISPDGQVCNRVLARSVSGWISEKEREVYEIASDYAKTVKPKKIKMRDGHSEIYDPTKHCR